PAAAGEGDVPEKVQFVLSIELRHGAVPAGDLLFITRSGARYRAPVESAFRGDPVLRETGEGPPLQYAITARDFSPSRDAASLAVENFLGKHYRYLMMIFSVAAAIAACVLLIRRRLARRHLVISLIIVLLTVAVLSRVALLTAMDVNSWSALDPRFLLPVVPLYVCLLLLLIEGAVRVLRPDLRDGGATSAA
ncbi:MAG TPA: hypothetical protein VF683_11435, partial [Chthoniobacterales bacterium]